MRKFILFSLIITLLYLLYWKYQIAMNRFFDVDEFTHMHWAFDMLLRGKKPYIDFYTFFPPGFYWFLSPLVFLFRNDPNIFLAGRAFAFVVMVLLALLVSVLFGLQRSWRWAILPAVILLFLPMPYDKFLEIRPDNLAALFAFAGLVFLAFRRWTVSGLLYGASLVVLPKTLPFVAVGIFAALILRKMKPFFIGMFMPLGIFGIWVLTLGDIDTVWYALTKMSLEAYGVGNVAIMEPHLFFFPNAAFYGGWGITRGLLLNHTLWIAGVLVGVVRLCTPFLASRDKKSALIEFVIAATFIANVLAYVSFFPWKHAQYLIPIALFIAYYAADGLVWLLTSLEKKGGYILVVTLVLVMALSFISVTPEINQGKLALDNKSQLAEMNRLLTTISPTDEVFDIEGRAVWWNSPPYICCLSLGEFVQFLSRQPKPVRDVLEEKNVAFVYQGTSGRLGSLPSDDLVYIKTYYQPVEGWGERLWQRK